MRYGIIMGSYKDACNGLSGGGGRVAAELVNAIPNHEIHEVIINGRFKPVRRRLQVINESLAAKKWASANNLYGIINMYGIPPRAGPYRRFAYVHTSLWNRMERSKWSLGLFRRYTRYMQMKHREGCIFLCNSRWVRDEFAARSACAHVVYPPCRIATEYVTPTEEREIAVLSVGRLVKAKRHNFVSKVAKQAGCRCTVLGSGRVNGLVYGNHCTVRTNVTDSIIDSACRSHKVIMSGCHVEDFGIAVVEAVSRGCIPVVPDAYGFRETIPYDELRYKPYDEGAALRVMQEALSGVYDDLIPSLRKHMLQYSVERFNSNVKKILLE